MSTSLTPGSRRAPGRRALAGLGAVAFITAALAACSAPGSSSGGDASAEPSDVSTDLGSEPIELTLYDGAGLKNVDEALIAAFEAKYPNVSITGRYDPDDVQATNAPRVLASDDPPDIARINALADIVGNGQLAALTPWSQAYGWDIPAGQLAMYTVDEDGVRGSGTQYTVASGFVLTGLYYNTDVAARAGMTTPPTTLEELETALSGAKDAGVVPLMVGNQTGGGAFPVQMQLNNQLGGQAINDWVFNAPDATIDTPQGQAGVQTIADWIGAGYTNADANGTDATTALGRFAQGEALFYGSGNWDAKTLQEQMGDTVAFVLPPVAQAGDSPLAMSNPVSNFGIPAKADQKDAAAAFLNFLLSPEARQVLVDNGFAPSGAGEAPSTEPGSLNESIQSAFADLVEADGQVQFVQDATSGINTVWNQQTQLLFDDRVTPADYLANIQASYEEQLGR